MKSVLEDPPHFLPTRADSEEPGENGATHRERETLRECVTYSLKDYFNRVDPEHVSNLYELVLSEVEAPLLKTVMEYTRSNQSKASVMLGLNRGTLRKKLKQYGMLE